MDRTTFWSHTAPSYESIDSSESLDDALSTHHENRECDSSSSYHSIIHYHIESIELDEEPSITVRVFHTIDVEHEDRREKKFRWFNKK